VVTRCLAYTLFGTTCTSTNLSRWLVSYLAHMANVLDLKVPCISLISAYPTSDQWTSSSSLIHRIFRLLLLASSLISYLQKKKHPTYLVILCQNRRLHHPLSPLLLCNRLSRFRFLLRTHQRAPLLRRKTCNSHFAAHCNTSLVACFCIHGDGALFISLDAGAAACVVCETGSVAGARVDDCAIWKAHFVRRYTQSS
jgi:hypothetical protein